ncbi:hypothetical protein [Nocardia vinacea]|uniref:hypothetical protein n=1 Tax=Nocardia vinacea TaxID=96468 RepID=UPI00146F6448|nr:hypothetical protein [Nocardia vinacea]
MDSAWLASRQLGFDMSRLPQAGHGRGDIFGLAGESISAVRLGASHHQSHVNEGDGLSLWVADGRGNHFGAARVDVRYCFGHMSKCGGLTLWIGTGCGSDEFGAVGNLDGFIGISSCHCRGQAGEGGGLPPRVDTRCTCRGH